MNDYRLGAMDDGSFDEVFVKEPMTTHLEVMDNDHLWIRITTKEGTEIVLDVYAVREKIVSQKLLYHVSVLE